MEEIKNVNVEEVIEETTVEETKKEGFLSKVKAGVKKHWKTGAKVALGTIALGAAFALGKSFGTGPEEEYDYVEPGEDYGPDETEEDTLPEEI